MYQMTHDEMNRIDTRDQCKLKPNGVLSDYYLYTANHFPRLNLLDLYSPYKLPVHDNYPRLNGHHCFFMEL